MLPLRCAARADGGEHARLAARVQLRQRAGLQHHTCVRTAAAAQRRACACCDLNARPERTGRKHTSSAARAAPLRAQPPRRRARRTAGGRGERMSRAARAAQRLPARGATTCSALQLSPSPVRSAVPDATAAHARSRGVQGAERRAPRVRPHHHPHTHTHTQTKHTHTRTQKHVPSLPVPPSRPLTPWIFQFLHRLRPRRAPRLSGVLRRHTMAQGTPTHARTHRTHARMRRTSAEHVFAKCVCLPLLLRARRRCCSRCRRRR
jgi:hypothetical protein